MLYFTSLYSTSCCLLLTVISAECLCYELSLPLFMLVLYIFPFLYGTFSFSAHHWLSFPLFLKLDTVVCINLYSIICRRVLCVPSLRKVNELIICFNIALYNIRVFSQIISCSQNKGFVHEYF